jgi:hypothetical protein
MRGWLGSLQQKYILNKQWIWRMIDDASRRLKLKPRTIVRGIIRGLKPLPGLLMEVRGQDFLSALLDPNNKTTQIPREAISRTQFTKCPTDNVGKPVNSILGTVGEGVSATAPPTITGDVADGFFLNGGVEPHLGYGTLTGSLAAPPTSPTVVAGSGGSGSLPASAPNSQWGAMVTAVDVNGVETDPVPFYSDINFSNGAGSFTGTPVPFATVDGTKKITVSWTASAGASKYRVYYGYYYYGFRPDLNGRYVEVNAPTVSVDILTENDGNLITFNQSWYYAVSAQMADGETALSSPVAFGAAWTHRRPIRLEWNPVVGATGYNVYRKGAGGGWDHQWSTPNTFFEDDLRHRRYDHRRPPRCRVRFRSLTSGRRPTSPGSSGTRSGVRAPGRGDPRGLSDGTVVDAGHYGDDPRAGQGGTPPISSHTGHRRS